MYEELKIALAVLAVLDIYFLLILKVREVLLVWGRSSTCVNLGF